MVKRTLIRQVLQPVITRLGSVVGGFLLGAGMGPENVADVVAAIGVLAGFAVDVALRAYVNRGQV